MAYRRLHAGWLPSSTQLFAAVLLLSACGVVFSLATQPTSTSASKDAQVIFAVGRMVQCKAPQQANGSPVTAAAVAQRRTPARAGSFDGTGSATAVVRAGCSLQLTDLQKPGRQWVAGPYTQAQELELQITGVDVLDCLVHAEQQGNPTSEPPAYVFLLRSTTTTGKTLKLNLAHDMAWKALCMGRHTPQLHPCGLSQVSPSHCCCLRSPCLAGHDNSLTTQLEAVEYAQLPAQSDSTSTRALLESWLGGVSLPDSCLTALHTVGSNQHINRAGAEAHWQDVAHVSSTGRQLRQDSTAPDAATAPANIAPDAAAAPANTAPDAAAAPAPANTTTYATTPAVAEDATATEEQQTAESGSNNSNNSSIATTDSNLNSINSTTTRSMNSTAAPEVLAQDQLLTEEANSTQPAFAVDSSVLSNITAASARVVCALQPETGPCRGSLRRWAFDSAAGGCREFVYGGCQGNANNFVSQQACEATCSAAMVASPSPAAADVPPPSGPVFVTVDDPRLLAASASAPASSSAGHGRFWAEQLVRVMLAGVVGVMMLLLL